MLSHELYEFKRIVRIGFGFRVLSFEFWNNSDSILKQRFNSSTIQRETRNAQLQTKTIWANIS